jgi:hypothetical protein
MIKRVNLWFSATMIKRKPFASGWVSITNKQRLWSVSINPCQVSMRLGIIGLKVSASLTTLNSALPKPWRAS